MVAFAGKTDTELLTAVADEFFSNVAERDILYPTLLKV